ncbi:hypothetical protein H9649_08180 [Sporosarcina sp. Sa2YVA2]|uniref:DUF5667 domain-containing protein n=1 Tax=Sporosarcina quadrami TaxID=2762234 RepID=A0ABR8UAG7_9BACL|nr:hypothetical protein [Sporosarcina quadrami]MBD7984554.1 hypothetical protein [Sporosarcina quadrami]
MKKRQNTNFAKIGMLCTILLLTIAIGSGMNKAFAGQNIQGLLTSWFEGKKDTSIEQIDQAITSEKERLMAELKDAISEEIQRAEAELDQFTADETALRVSMLQSYAAELMGNLNINNEAEQAAITANLDAALQQAMFLLNGSISHTPSLPEPVPPSKPVEESIPVSEEVSEESVEEDAADESKDVDSSDGEDVVDIEIEIEEENDVPVVDEEHGEEAKEQPVVESVDEVIEEAESSSDDNHLHNL